MRRTTPTPAAIRAALAAQSLRTSNRWLVQFENGEVERKYQEAVTLSRVLSEHRAALAAIPLDDGSRDSAGTIGSPGLPKVGNQVERRL